VHRPSTRLSAGLAAAALTALTAVSASAADPVGAAATETLFISAGCPQDTPGTCTSTRWLGKQTGSATSNFLTATTPVDEVLFQADGTVNWRDYASDKSLRTGGYPLRADAPLTMAVTVTANALAVNSTVHGRLSGRIVDAVTGKTTTVALGEAKQVITLVADKKTVTFEFDLPDSLEGDTLTSVLAEVAVHGVNAQGGYIDQQGGSTVSIPYYEPAA
jgi:hypothetical protein